MKHNLSNVINEAVDLLALSFSLFIFCPSWRGTSLYKILLEYMERIQLEFDKKTMNCGYEIIYQCFLLKTEMKD